MVLVDYRYSASYGKVGVRIEPAFTALQAAA